MLSHVDSFGLMGGVGRCGWDLLVEWRVAWAFVKEGCTLCRAHCLGWGVGVDWCGLAWLVDVGCVCVGGFGSPSIWV
jgi:hypothetical protein